VITELVTQYAIDGVHLDYVRFPNEQFDYSRRALQQFKLEARPQLSDADRRRADAQERLDPFAYADLFPDRWRTFRQARLTLLVGRIRAAIKAVKPELPLSAAVVPDAAIAADSRFQDWRAWVDRQLIDVLCPMAYTTDINVFDRQIGAARGPGSAHTVWAGIGAYQLTTSATLRQIEAARQRKAAGVILFSYDALVSPPNSASSLAELGRTAFGSGSH
jgi:uncharacterized lipoprotein YddW (UPF0748 family)